MLCSRWKPSTELPSSWISSLDLELSSPPSSLTPHMVPSIVQVTALEFYLTERPSWSDRDARGGGERRSPSLQWC